MSSRKRARSVATTPVTEPSAAPAARKVSISGGVAQPPRMVDMWRQGTLCDATITAEGCDFEVHRNVASAGSEFFFGAFTSGLAESGSASVSLPEIKAAAIEAVLCFLYTGACEVDEVALSSLLTASAYLQTTTLTEAVAAKIEERLEPHTCLDVWEVADAHNLPGLATAAKETALKHFEAVAIEGGTSATTQRSFTALPHARLLELLADARLTATKEEAVHDAIVRWAQAQSERPTDEALLPLFAAVRYPLVSREFFEKLSTQEPLLQGALGAKVFSTAFLAGIFEGRVSRRLGFVPFSGILLNSFKVSDLANWTAHHVRGYDHETRASDLDSIPSSATWVLVGARYKTQDVLKLCAVGKRDEVLKRTKKNEPHEHNGAWWYFTGGKSFGFAPNGTICQESADTHDASDPKRLSWHMNGDGYRAGAIDYADHDDDDDEHHTKLVYYT